MSNAGSPKGAPTVKEIGKVPGGEGSPAGNIMMDKNMSIQSSNKGFGANYKIEGIKTNQTME